MAKEYDNNMTGVLFKNDRKKADKEPDYNGSCEIDHKKLEIAGWIKEGKQSGKKFISFSFREPRDDRNGNDDRRKPDKRDDSSSDTPF